MCRHREHALVGIYPTTYSQQSCRSCVLSHYSHKTPKPPQHPKPPSPIQSKGASNVVTAHTQHGPPRDVNDVRPGEVPEFLASISTNTDILNQHKATWENIRKEEEEEEEKEEEEENKDEKGEGEKNSLTADATSESPPPTKEQRCNSNKTLLQNRDKQHKISTHAQLFYKTSTQKLYEGADWSTFLKPRVPAPLHTRQPELTYALKNIQWKNEPLLQSQVPRGHRSWDSCQLRVGEGKENQALAFTSASPKTDQIPNYSGSVGGFGEKDMNIRGYQPLSCVRTCKPRYAETSRKPYIPGYGGFTSTVRADEVFSAEPLPRAETTAASYSRRGGSESNVFSQHRHRSPLSKTVTKVHPFNPFNRVNYALNRTVGENIV